MNLETRIDARLWKSVRISAESRNYKAAILDAVHLISDVIRERAGVEGDGVALVSAAFGGKSPKLKVNRLQTESEVNVQRGIESLLRGIYQAIRNPRSHESMQDSERDFEAIALFLNFLVGIVDKSKSPFSLETFVSRVIDPDFVASDRYAELLAAEIPAKKRLPICREVFARRTEVEPGKMRYFFAKVMPDLEKSERDEFCELISDVFRETDEAGTILFVLGALPSVCPNLSEVAKIRIKNKLIRAVKEGKWDRKTSKCRGGAIATWSISCIKHFVLKGDFWYAVFDKLNSYDASEHAKR